MKGLIRSLPFLFALCAVPARAFQLDTLLPDTVPGYGTPFGVTDINRLRRVDDSAGVRLGGLTLDPSLQVLGGYDSAPNGVAGGSGTVQVMPSLIALDAELGLGAYAAGNLQRYPANPEQNATDAVLAVGERAALPRETITVAAAIAKVEETGFSLTTVALNKPQAFTLDDLRASDRISLGLFNLVPELSASRVSAAGAPLQERADYREGLTAEYAPGGPATLLLFLHATQSRYRVAAFNGDTNEALVGLQEEQQGLWTMRLLAGLARRGAAAGGAVTAPVLEASADWVPDDLDHLSLQLAREIDDPDEISAAPYTLSRVRLVLAHEYLRNVILNLTMEADHADYLHSALRETLLSSAFTVGWHLNAALTVNADYAFNDRQANYLRAANEHVVTLGLTWTP